MGEKGTQKSKMEAEGSFWQIRWLKKALKSLFFNKIYLKKKSALRGRFIIFLGCAQPTQRGQRLKGYHKSQK